MRIEAYLSIGGDERTIRKIHEETKVSGATIRSYPKAKARWSVTGEDNPWGWGTTPILLDVDNPDAGLREMLIKYKPIFPTIRKHLEERTAVLLQIVTRYKRGEDPRGIYLSAETISLIHELGAALDNDVVWLMDEYFSAQPGADEGSNEGGRGN